MIQTILKEIFLMKKIRGNILKGEPAFKEQQSTTPAERKRAERKRDKAKGLIRRDVKAHPDDWAEIRALELKLKSKRYD
jgi:hypothetical protein